MTVSPIFCNLVGPDARVHFVHVWDSDLTRLLHGVGPYILLCRDGTPDPLCRSWTQDPLRQGGTPGRQLDPTRDQGRRDVTVVAGGVRGGGGDLSSREKGSEEGST